MLGPRWLTWHWHVPKLLIPRIVAVHRQPSQGHPEITCSLYLILSDHWQITAVYCSAFVMHGRWIVRARRVAATVVARIRRTLGSRRGKYLSNILFPSVHSVLPSLQQTQAGGHPACLSPSIHHSSPIHQPRQWRSRAVYFVL